MESTPLSEIKQKLQDRYQTQGFSDNLFMNDWNLLLRMGVHPNEATLEDLQNVIMTAKAQSTRANYASRLRSLYKSMHKLRLIDNHVIDDVPTPRKGRGVPHPISPNEAKMLMTEARLPERHWFTLGCLVGLRAMEVSKIRGVDLEETADGYVLRVAGKGGTDLTVPVNQTVVDLIKSYNTNGRLFTQPPNRLSKRASAEMKRLGIPKLTFHSCRHYYATTVLKVSKGDLLLTSQLMRHSSVATTQVYTQLESGKKRSIVDLL